MRYAGKTGKTFKHSDCLRYAASDVICECEVVRAGIASVLFPLTGAIPDEP